MTEILPWLPAIAIGLMYVADKYVMSQTLKKQAQQVDELHKVHLGPNAIDEDGSPRWWVKHSFEEAMVKLADSISKLSDFLREIHSVSQETLKEVKKKE
jgi:hypothetical protein